MNALITGYIREVEANLNEQIIPNEIYQLCHYYYPFTKRLVLLKRHNGNLWSSDVNSIGEIYSSNIATIDETDNWILQIPKGYHKERRCLITMGRFGSLCYAKNVSAKQYNILFSSEGFGILLTDKRKEYTSLRIPPLTMKHQHYAGLYPIRGNDIVFSNKYGLISVGGDQPNAIYNLSFQSINYDELFNNDNNYQLYGAWQWNRVGNLRKGRRWTSSVLINHNGNDEKLFVVGGYDSNNHNRMRGSFEIINFVTTDSIDHEYSHCHNINVPRAEAGICYDKHSENIYIGGGTNPYYGDFEYWRDAECSMECYNLTKMKSYSKYPDTKYKHKCYPLLWKDEAANILNIASIKNEYIEWIDLRLHNKTWNKKDRKLNEIFKTPEKYDKIHHSSARLFI